MDRIGVRDLFDLTHTDAARALEACSYPWEILARIEAIVVEIGETLNTDRYECIGERIWSAKSAKISPMATIIGPCVIGEDAEIRPGAYIRGNVLIGCGAVVGNSSELKNCILFDGVQVPHYNYVGDSVLGYKAHMGAGAITSNVKGDKAQIIVHGENEYETGRKKFGAIVGDFAEVGCNSVLNPGTIIGRNTQVYPLSSVRGVVPANCIVKGDRGIVEKTNDLR